jgi:tetratricopeptide (TPR) repeat protein
MSIKKSVRYPELSKALLHALGSRTHQWLATQCGVSQPAVNDWINGYDRPRLAHLALIAFHCNTDPQELAIVADYNPAEISRVYDELVSGETVFQDLIEVFETEPALIHDLLIRSDPKLAVDQAIVKVNLLQKALNHYESPKYRRPLLNTFSKLLYALAVAYWANNKLAKAIEHLETSAKQQYLIAKETRDEGPLSRSYMTKGFIYYAQGTYDVAQKFFLKASSTNIEDDLGWQPETYRNLALSSAYIGDVQEYKRAEYNVRRFLDSENGDSPLMIIRHNEGLGRAQALLRMPKALNTIDIGWSNLAKIEAQGSKLIYLHLELMRSQIIATRLTKGNDRKLIEEIGNTGLALSENHGYTKYVLQFKDFLMGFD